MALGDDRRPLAGGRSPGQTIEAWWIAVEHADPLIVGVNCSLGAAEMRPHVEALARIAPTYVSCHPNAGLPNAFGGYDEQPADTSRLLGEFARDGLLNVVGGCCGTTPEHTKAIADAVRGLAPRRVPTAAAARPRLQRPRAVRDQPGHRLRDDRRAHERDRLHALPRLDRGRRLPGRGRRSRSSRCAAARTCST